MGGKSEQDWPSVQLIQAAKRGEAVAWGKLVESYHSYLMAVARCILNDRTPDDWSSVVQDGLLNAWRHFDQFHGDTPQAFLAWMAMIVRNRARDRRKAGPLATAELPVDLSCEDGDSPSAHLLRRERAAKLFSAMQRLPADYREVTELRFFHNLSHEQIALRMNRTNDAVRSLLMRALRRLRDELGTQP
jgi:RNA polymerase sigma-70 factor (ECF subfamily)